MASYFITLVSDQTIPNILLLRELPVCDHYLFVTTLKMEANGRTESIVRVAQLPLEKVRKVQVMEDSLMDIQTKLENLHLGPNDVYRVNLTGGTKMMSLGVYTFFANRNVEMFYVPIGKNGFKKIFPSTAEAIQPFSYPVTLLEYLDAYQVKVLNAPDINRVSMPVKFTQDFFSQQWANHPAIRELNFFKSKVERNPYTRLRRLSASQLPDLWGFLHTVQFPFSDSSTLNEGELCYLTGGWFEEFVYQKLLEQLGLAAGFIGINVQIQQKESPNECDVMFMHNNDLFVVECKTRLTKVMFDHAAYKLAAIRKDFGLQAKGFLFASENYEDKHGIVPKSAMDRARFLDFKIIDRKLLVSNEIGITEPHRSERNALSRPSFLA